MNLIFFVEVVHNVAYSFHIFLSLLIVFGIKLDSKISKAQLFSQMYLYCK